MVIQGPLRVFSSLETHIAQCKRALGAIEVAQGKYEEKVAAANASITRIQDQLSSNREQQPGLRDTILEFGTQLEQLGLDHETEVANYEQQHRAAFEKLCDNMIVSLESPVVEKSLEIHSQQISFETEPSTPRRRLSASWTSALLSIEPRHYAMVDDHMEDTIVCASDEPEKKRRRTSSPKVCRRKRQRFSKEQSGMAGKSIRFEDVYQNGRAAIKHTIVQFPAEDGPWFILRCDVHGLSFKNNPIRSAATHLGGEKHGQMSRTPAVAIKHLGIEVLGCNAALARKNNAVALDAYRRGSKHPIASIAADELEREPASSPCDMTPTRLTRSCRRDDVLRSPDDDSRQKHKDFDTITDPIPGEIYLAYWELSRIWSPVLVLPQEHLDNVGVPDTLEDLGLIDTVPKCYRYDRRLKKLKWREQYKDGQPLIAKRQFPVMYFDGLEFPESCSVGWVAAADLRVLDIGASKSSLIPNYKSMRTFLRKRAATDHATDKTRFTEKIPATNFNRGKEEAADATTLLHEDEADYKTPPLSVTMESSDGMDISTADLLTYSVDPLVSTLPVKQLPDEQLQDEKLQDEELRAEVSQSVKSTGEQPLGEQPPDEQKPVAQSQVEQPQVEQLQDEKLGAGQSQAEEETHLDEYPSSSASSEEDHEMCDDTDEESVSSTAVLDEVASDTQGLQTPPLQNGYMATPPPSTTQLQPRRPESSLSHLLNNSQTSDNEDLGHEQNQSELAVVQSIPFRPLPTFTLPGLHALNLQAIGRRPGEAWPELEMSEYRLPPIDPTRQLKIHPPTIQRHDTVMSPVDFRTQGRLLSRSPRTPLPTGSSSPDPTMQELAYPQDDPAINILQTSSSTTQSTSRGTIDPPDSCQLGVYPFVFKPHILHELSDVSRTKHKHPAFSEFRNSRGFLRCPLKHRTSRGAEFVHIRGFVNHLRSKH